MFIPVDHNLWAYY